MINQVVVAGRLTSNPTQVGTAAAEFVLEIEHAPFHGATESCEVTVRIEHEGSAGVARRWLEKDRWITVDGHLRVDGERWLVVCERWQFLPRELEPRCLWHEDAHAPEPAGAGIAF
ncbi:MAG: hypothetical protein R3F62_26980 [Planctomycetota bacterium]